jgi:hypothetical protein
MNNTIKNRILEYVRSKGFFVKEHKKVVEIPINVDGRNFYAKWTKYKDNGLLYDLFLYKKFVVPGINTNFNKCKGILEGYIRLHQEFLQPNGPIELKKTINLMVDGVYRRLKEEDYKILNEIGIEKNEKKNVKERLIHSY